MVEKHSPSDNQLRVACGASEGWKMVGGRETPFSYTELTERFDSLHMCTCDLDKGRDLFYITHVVSEAKKKNVHTIAVMKGS